MNIPNVEQVIREYVVKHTEKIIQEELAKSHQEIRKRIEAQAMTIAIAVASQYRVDTMSDGITISVIKKGLK